jgi:hypothetical protein
MFELTSHVWTYLNYDIPGDAPGYFLVLRQGATPGMQIQGAEHRKIRN